MSKPHRAILFFSFALALVLQASNYAQGQALEVAIRVEGETARVEGKFLDAGSTTGTRKISFLNSQASTQNLGARISGLVLSGRDGQRLEHKKLIDGEFLTQNDLQAWSYKTNLSLPNDLSAMAHVSWLGPEKGILMLDDLLPQFGKNTSAKVSFELPANWKITTVEKRSAPDVFEVSDLEKAVFFVGQNWREREIQSGGSKINLTISGEWKFSDEQAFQMSHAIFAEYQKLFGGSSFPDVAIFVGKFPGGAKFGRWEAETRGASVTILSADMPFSTQSVQKLHEQLRHEIFHLWIPNGVNLSGNYDWFYEGFALYQSLRTAVALNRIRFEDFLDTLSRAYDIDALMTQRTSLIEASKNRWSGANTQVYARGMLVAFLTDLALLQKSKGKSSLTDILREIYQKHRYPNPREEANAAILKILESRAETRRVIENYVKGKENIAWQTDLEAVGIETRTENFSTKLNVKAKTNGRQRDLLDKLGYNNWRNRSDLSK